jgi:hypothetical protein
MATSAQDGAQHAHDDCAANRARDSAVTRACRALGVLLALGQVGAVLADALAGVDHGRVIRTAWCGGAAGQQGSGCKSNELHDSSGR